LPGCFMNSKPSLFIIILNWNGWKDTVECLESLLQIDYPNYRLIVIDNGSSDHSVERITEWARGELEVESGRLVLIQNEENLGFASGSNVGIQYALANHSDYILLLNNDTVVEKTAFSKLIDFLETHPDYDGATGQIRYYHNPSRVWNCGGFLTWYGCRKYLYGNVPVQKIQASGWRKISFITGCAALFRGSIFEKVGLLSNQFFFGEEDFEFSYRLKKQRSKIACCFQALIFHKVGASIEVKSVATKMGKIYIHYLQRFISLRQYWIPAIWKLWRLLYLFYIVAMLKIKHRFSWRNLWFLRKILIKDSNMLTRVDRATFEYAIQYKFLEQEQFKG
jgi:GT2 family glycosyltransferase